MGARTVTVSAERNCMSTQVLSLRHTPAAPCVTKLCRPRVLTSRAQACSNELTAATARASGALYLASLVLLSSFTAAPAGAKPEYADYISVQQRQQRRSPLQQRSKAQDDYLSASDEEGPALSISQQAGTSC